MRHHGISGEIVECYMANLNSTIDTDRIERLRRLQSTVFVGGITRNHSGGGDILEYFRNLGGNTNILIFEPDSGYAVVAFRSLRNARDVGERRFLEVSGETLECVSFFDRKQVERLKLLQATVVVDGAVNKQRHEVWRCFNEYKDSISKFSFFPKTGYARITFKNVRAARDVVRIPYRNVSGLWVFCKRERSIEQLMYERLPR